MKHQNTFTAWLSGVFSD